MIRNLESKDRVYKGLTRGLRDLETDIVVCLPIHMSFENVTSLMGVIYNDLV